MLISLAFILLVSMNCSAETLNDPTSDIYHWKQTGTNWGWETDIGGKPNIDITEITYQNTGDEVTLSLKVSGTITNSNLVSYWAYYNTSDSNYYLAWNDGTGMGWGLNADTSSGQFDYSPDVTASGNTITAVYDVVGSSTSGVEVWGWAAEYTTYGDISNEWWGDWVPNQQSPYYTEVTNEDDSSGDDDLFDDAANDGSNNDDSTDDTNTGNGNNTPGTPGFELITLIAAIGIAFIIYRSRK